MLRAVTAAAFEHPGVVVLVLEALRPGTDLPGTEHVDAMAHRLVDQLTVRIDDPRERLRVLLALQMVATAAALGLDPAQPVPELSVPQVHDVALHAAAAVLAGAPAPPRCRPSSAAHRPPVRPARPSRPAAPPAPRPTPPRTPMSSLLYAFGRLAHRRWRAVLLVWVLVLGAGGTAALTLSAGHDELLQHPRHRVPGGPGPAGGDLPPGQRVVGPGGGRGRRRRRPRRDRLGGRGGRRPSRALDDVAAVSPVLAEDGTLLPDAQVSDDGSTLLLTAQLDVGRDEVTEEVSDALLDVVAARARTR